MGEDWRINTNKDVHVSFKLLNIWVLKPIRKLRMMKRPYARREQKAPVEGRRC
jgi:hypothetical protein